MIVGACCGSGGTVSNVTDTKNSHYHQLASVTNASNNTSAQWASAGCNTLTTTDSITVTWNTTISGGNAIAAATTYPAYPDQVNTASGTSASPSAAVTGTWTQDAAFAVLVSGNAGGTPAYGYGWTLLQATGGGGGTAHTSMAYALVPAGTTTAAATITSTNWGFTLTTAKFNGSNPGPPAYPLLEPVHAKPPLPPRGQYRRTAGTRQQTGPPAYPLLQPVRAAQPLPARGKPGTPPTGVKPPTRHMSITVGRPESDWDTGTVFTP